MQLITLIIILVGFTGRHPCALTTMIVQCSYYQWKNFFEALDKETAITCRTIARKNEHVLKKQYMYFKMFVIKLCNFFLSKRHLGCLLIFIGLVSKPGSHTCTCTQFVKLHHVFLFVSFPQLHFILLGMLNDNNFIDNYQGSKFKFEFGSTCATRCKFLGALLKLQAHS